MPDQSWGPPQCTIEASIGKLDLSDDLFSVIMRGGYLLLPIQVSELAELSMLPMHHRNPFDRILVAQARVQGLTLDTRDRVVSEYDVRTLSS